MENYMLMCMKDLASIHMSAVYY